MSEQNINERFGVISDALEDAESEILESLQKLSRKLVSVNGVVVDVEISLLNHMVHETARRCDLQLFNVKLEGAFRQGFIDCRVTRENQS